MTTFVNNDVSPGNVVQASDHNTQGSLLAAVVNGSIDNANIASGAAIAGSKLADDSVTAAKLAEAFLRGRYQDGAGTNTAPTGLTLQQGWNYMVGDGSADINETITFPAAFSAAPIVFVQYIGQRNTADGTPTGPAWFTGGTTAVGQTQVNNITTTNFVHYLRVEGGASTSASVNYGYTWLAIGTV